MNSQFKNSNLGFVLYALIIFVIAVVLVIISWYMITGYKLGTYKEDTILGSVYLGGLKEEDVDVKINDRVDIWLEDPTIVFELTYQGYNYEFDRHLFYFNVNLSKDRLKDGVTNELIAEYQSSGTDFADTIDEIYYLPFLDDIKDNVDILALVNDILDDAGLMKTFSSKSVEDYLIVPEDSQDEISSIIYDVPEGVNVDYLIQGIEAVYGDNYIDIESKELFDIIDMLGSELDDYELTVLSSAMLNLSLATNFSIHEVHYDTTASLDGYEIADYPYFGSNSKINEVVDNSFSFYNPNESMYMFMVEREDDDSIKVSLVGLPFVSEITVDIEITEIDFITQYITNDEQIQIGRNGVVVVVIRTITNLDGEVVYNQNIVFEFYPPENEKIIQPSPA